MSCGTCPLFHQPTVWQAAHFDPGLLDWPSAFPGVPATPLHEVQFRQFDRPGVVVVFHHGLSPFFPRPCHVAAHGGRVNAQFLVGGGRDPTVSAATNGDDRP